MILNYKLIILGILNLLIAKLVKTQYDFRGMDTKQPIIQKPPDTSRPTINGVTNCIACDPPTNPPIKQSSSDCSETFISFSNVGLRKIDHDFIKSNDIISLSLDDNQIEKISLYAFRSMRNLRHLNLSGNKIPKDKLLSFNGISRLQTLIINNNNNNTRTKSNVLNEYEIFESLEYLHVCNSQLLDFEVPFHIITPVLSHLHLSNNSIKSGNVVFDNIPSTLIHLSIDNNLINKIEQDKLRNLQELVMDNNTITQVCFEECKDHSISLKGASRMKKLSLSKNLISDISADAFTDTKHLLSLDLSGNRIIDISKGTFNNSVRVTDLSLAENELTSVPDICFMTQLKSLNLTGNRIGSIHLGSFCLMRRLDHLYLANNAITAIESQAFANLQVLKYLDLSGNQLSQLPAQWVSPWHLQELLLERNRFTKLDDMSLFDITGLNNVYIGGNPILSFTTQTFKSFSMPFTIHVKNVPAESKCAPCNCKNENEDEDY